MGVFKSNRYLYLCENIWGLHVDNGGNSSSIASINILVNLMGRQVAIKAK